MSTPNAEKAVLGVTIATHGAVYPEVALATHDGKAFSTLHSRGIWEAMAELFDGGEEIDAPALINLMADQPSRRDNACRLDDVGGPTAITDLTRYGYSDVHLAADLDRVVEAWRVRIAADELQRTARYIHDAGVTSDGVIERLHAWADKVSTLSAVDTSAPNRVAARFRERWEQMLSGERISRYATGIEPLDMVTRGGFSPGTMSVIAGYSKHGKSTLAYAAAGRLAREHDAIVLVYPCEGYEQLHVARFLCAALGDLDCYQYATPGGSLRPSLREDWLLRPQKLIRDAPTSVAEQIIEHSATALKWWHASRVYLKSVGPIDVRTIELDLKAMRARHPDRPIVCVVDYLQHCHTGDSRQPPRERIAEASRRINGVTGQCEVMTLALTQYTDTSSEDAPIKLPTPQQVREAKDIRNDAAQIITWHRPYQRGNVNQSLGVCEVMSREADVAHVLMHMDGATKKMGWWRDPVPDLPGVYSPRLQCPPKHIREVS